jgi:hypothetical protein
MNAAIFAIGGGTGKCGLMHHWVVGRIVDWCLGQYFY